MLFIDKRTKLKLDIQFIDDKRIKIEAAGYTPAITTLSGLTSPLREAVTQQLYFPVDVEAIFF